MGDIVPYNPLNKANLGKSVAEALLSQPMSILPPNPFKGAGVYAIYYNGNFPLYNEVVKREIPIYVGKAVPAGARIGLHDSSTAVGNALYNRLFEHAESIKYSNNLFLEDFTCKFLVVDDIWIPLGESLIINKFKPLWNVIIAGFGNHDPGSGRSGQKKSHWDILHEGRPWASKLVGTSTSYLSLVDSLTERIKHHFMRV